MPRPKKEFEEPPFDLEDEVINLPEPAAPEEQPRGIHDIRTTILLLIFTVVLLGWVATYLIIEDHAAPIAFGVTHFVFGLVGAGILWQWIAMGWAAIEWEFIPKCALVGVALVAAGHRAFLDKDGLSAAFILLPALLLAASPAFELGIRILADFLHHPKFAKGGKK